MSTTPTCEQLREHPQLAMLATLATQLSLVVPVLAAVHREGDATAPSEQARSMVRVVRILQSQLDAYTGLLAVGDPRAPARPGRPRS